MATPWTNQYGIPEQIGFAIGYNEQLTHCAINPSEIITLTVLRQQDVTRWQINTRTLSNQCYS
jgi:hypothetical protein